MEDGHSYLMVLVREFFQTFTDLPIGDPAVSPTSSTAVFLDSREAVDATAAAGLAAGGSEPRPAADYGFMYQRGITDPDGNNIEFGWMDPATAEQGPAAYGGPAGLRPVAARDYGQYCGVTRALELVGERWAVLIVRDLLVGPRRYGELAAGLPRIPTNILAARLKELQAAGIIRRAPRSRVVVYELTPYGRELEPVVLALGAWGFKAMGEPRADQIVTADSMSMALRTAFRPEVGGDAARHRLRGAPRPGRPARPGRRPHPGGRRGRR